MIRRSGKYDRLSPILKARLYGRALHAMIRRVEFAKNLQFKPEKVLGLSCSSFLHQVAALASYQLFFICLWRLINCSLFTSDVWASLNLSPDPYPILKNGIFTDAASVKLMLKPHSGLSLGSYSVVSYSVVKKYDHTLFHTSFGFSVSLQTEWLHKSSRSYYCGRDAHPDHESPGETAQSELCPWYRRHRPLG